MMERIIYQNSLNVSSLFFLIDRYPRNKEMLSLLTSNLVWMPIFRLLLETVDFKVSYDLVDDIQRVQQYIVIVDTIVATKNMLADRMERTQNPDSRAELMRYIRNEQVRLDQLRNDPFIDIFNVFKRIWDSMVHIEYDNDRIEMPAFGYPMYGHLSDLVYWVEVDIVNNNVFVRQQGSAEHRAIYLGLPSQSKMINMDSSIVVPYNENAVDVNLIKDNIELPQRTATQWLSRTLSAVTGVGLTYFGVLGLVNAVNYVIDLSQTLTMENSDLSSELSVLVQNLKEAKENLYRYTAIDPRTGSELFPVQYQEQVRRLGAALKAAVQELESVREAKRALGRGLSSMLVTGTMGLYGLLRTALSPAYTLGQDIFNRARFDRNTLDALAGNEEKRYGGGDEPDALILVTAPNERDVLAAFRLIRKQDQAPIVQPLSVMQHRNVQEGRLNAPICYKCGERAKIECRECDRMYCSEGCHE